MERGERFYYIHRRLRSGACLPLQHFLDHLEVSRATFKRDIEYLRDRYRAPIVYDRDAGGYRYDRANPNDARFELPGLWFSPEELHGLLTMDALMQQMDQEMLGEPLALLRQRLVDLLGEQGIALEQLQKRVHVFQTGVRRRISSSFPTVAHAVMTRRRLRMRYWTRSRDSVTERVVSPQRLIFYRGNWYLDGWCHLRDGLRNFSVDAIVEVEPLTDDALDIEAGTLQAELGAAYGIFSGQPDQWAVLRFSAERSRWVKDELWHPEQESSVDAQGCCTLRIPYHHDEELVGEILRHGREVEVLAPEALRKRVREAASR
ncbi:YafY family transcriptional regulator [Algiphilus sp. NNCM1]|uniref:helix-turn-helix transcriptional regulator n=1 Tax=Algiphilus sp. TaxID=1872431 RepID=UPI001CA629A5|nr:YafY family protein [Algiphilus sp.]MBY8964645.1 YafY family transcriptional regulator [Algiphilus acroporae]MCI5061587.1 YafY family transcriptional regulator [Algiphilus sp.]MCI5104846.1 YafY family transcriptional regulator [Algiphilus sp.]